MAGGGKSFISFDFTEGDRKAKASIQRYLKNVTTASEDAMQESAHQVLGVAMALVPEKSGKLAESGRVEMSQRGGVALPSGKGKKVQANVIFGGPDIPYAPFVEMGITPFGEMYNFTKAGSQAHFLRDAIEKTKPEMTKLLSSKLRRIRMNNL